MHYKKKFEVSIDLCTYIMYMYIMSFIKYVQYVHNNTHKLSLNNLGVDLQ